MLEDAAILINNRLLRFLDLPDLPPHKKITTPSPIFYLADIFPFISEKKQWASQQKNSGGYLNMTKYTHYMR